MHHLFYIDCYNKYITHAVLKINIIYLFIILKYIMIVKGLPL